MSLKGKVEKLKSCSKWQSPVLNKIVPNYHYELAQASILNSQILRFYSTHEKDLKDDCKFDDVFKLSPNPQRFQQAFTSNSFSVFISWVQSFQSETKNFAKNITTYFNKPSSDLDLFGLCTFPSIFYHFATNEYAEKACEFMKELFNVSRPFVFGEFFKGYFLNMPEFCNTFWHRFFLELSLCQNRTSPSNVLSALLKTLKVASSSLTKGHLEIIEIYYEKDPSNFGKYFVNGVLLTLYNERLEALSQSEYSEFIINNGLNSVSEFFDFVATHPKLPHLLAIKRAMTEGNKSMWIMPHALIHDNRRAKLVFTYREVFLIEDLVKKTTSKNIPLKITTARKVAPKKEKLFTIYFIDVTGHLIVNVDPFFKDTVVFNKEEKLEIENNEKFSRLYLALNRAAIENGKDVYDFFYRPTKAFADKISGMPPSFEDFMIKTYLNELFGVTNLYEQKINNLYYNSFITDLHNQSKNMMNTVLQAVAIKCLHQPKIDEAVKPKRRISLPPSPKKQSKIMKKLSVNWMASSNDIRPKVSLTTAYFNKDSRNSKVNEDDEEERVPVKEQKARTSEFFFFEEPEEEAPVKKEVKTRKKRSNSVGNGKVPSIKDSYKKMLENSMTEGKIYVLFRMIDQNFSTESKLDADVDKFLSYERNSIVTEYAESFSIASFFIKRIDYIAYLINEIQTEKPCALMQFVLERLIDIMEIDNQFVKKFPDAPENIVFNRFISQIKDNSIVISYIWYGRVKYIFLTDEKAIPFSLKKAATYLDKHMKAIFALCPENLSKKIEEARTKIY